MQTYNSTTKDSAQQRDNSCVSKMYSNDMMLRKCYKKTDPNDLLAYFMGKRVKFPLLVVKVGQGYIQYIHLFFLKCPGAFLNFLKPVEFENNV